VDAIATGNNAPDRFTGFRIHAKRLVFHALLQFETSNWFRGIGGLVNVNRHWTLLGGARLLFRLRCFFRGLRIGFHPLGVKHARFVDAFVGMRAKEVALGLEQI
jgi:hypothetical protein